MSSQVPTYNDFVNQYPVLIPPAVSASDVQRQIDFAARLLCKSVWGDWYSDGILLVAAHNLSLWLKTQSEVNGGFGAASGNVSSTSGAGLSISFESMAVVEGSKADMWYNRTAYGQQFLHLQSIVVASACLSY